MPGIVSNITMPCKKLRNKKKLICRCSEKMCKAKKKICAERVRGPEPVENVCVCVERGMYKRCSVNHGPHILNLDLRNGSGTRRSSKGKSGSRGKPRIGNGTKEHQPKRTNNEAPRNKRITGRYVVRR